MTVLLEQIELGDLDLLDHAWQPDPASIETAANDRFTRSTPRPHLRVAPTGPTGSR